MKSWLSDNIGTIAVLIVLAVIVGFAVVHMWKKRKKCGGCSGYCEHCRYSDKEQ